MNNLNIIDEKIKVVRVGNLPTISNPGQGEACHQLFKSLFFKTLLFSPSIPSKNYNYEINVLGNNLNFLFFPNFVFPRKTNFIKKLFLSTTRILSVFLTSMIILVNTHHRHDHVVHLLCVLGPKCHLVG